MISINGHTHSELGGFQYGFCGRVACTRRKYDSIWVFVYGFTKSAHFLHIKVTYSAENSANLYVREIMKLHVVSLTIILDRGIQLTSHFWKTIFQEGLCTKVKFSTAFHPRTNSQAECTIQTLECILRACVIDFKVNWDDNIPLIEFS